MTKRFLVTGRVQGVGFRFAAQAYALQLGLTGWVRNVLDGSVEILAEGTESSLISFEEWLCQGPPLSRIDKVQATVEQDRSSSEFRIL